MQRDLAALLALADRVEREEPSRELDAEVACVTRSAPPHAPGWLRRWSGGIEPLPGGSPGQITCVHTNGEAGANWPAPLYTTSIDAAATLVPDSRNWLAGKGRTRPDEPLYGAQIFAGTDAIAGAESNASTAAALCAAALRVLAMEADDAA